MCLFFDDLMRVFPKAKVILNVRPGKAWYKSMQKAIIEPRNFLEKPPISWIFGYYGIVAAKEVMTQVREKVQANRKLNYTTWTAVEAGEATALEYFEMWNRMVIDTVPPDRLLVYDVREGWEPLCEFLGLPVPEEPFPRLNDYETVQWIVKGGYYLLVLGLPGLILAAVCYKSKRVREACGPLLRMLAVVLAPIVYVASSKCFRRNENGKKR